MLPVMIEIAFRLLLSFAASYGIAAFCHEAGHLLIGKMSGGILLMFRVGRAVWISGSLRCFWYKEKPVSPGQCVLLCNGKGCIWTALGGCIANLAAGTLCMMYRIIYVEKSWMESFYSGDLCVSFMIVSLLMSALNLIPWPAQEANDGRLCYQLYSNEINYKEFLKEQRKCLFLLEAGQISEILG